MKKETLKEATERYFKDLSPDISFEKTVIFGSEWNKNKMFNELIKLVEKWQHDQWRYESMADKCMNLNDFKNQMKFTYKSQATRDCWKELHKLISEE